MTGRVLAAVDRTLRAEGSHAAGGGPVPWRFLGATVAAGGFLYGAVMGSFGGRALQSLFSGLKVPLLLAASTAVVLPSFYVLNSLLGLRRDFAAALRGILAAQAALAIALAALAPVTVVIYLSTDDYPSAIAWNGVQFAIATLAGQLTLNRHYFPLVARDRRHRIGRRAWLVLYVFVAIQMAWVLRPFVGAPDLPTRFFRPDAWSNAYVEVLEILWKALGGR